MATLIGFTLNETAGQTILTNTSPYYQRFVGAAEQWVRLPATSTLQLGWSFNIVNNSVAPLVIYSSDGSAVLQVPIQATAMVTCIDTSVSIPSSWKFGLTDFAIFTGTGGLVLSASPTLGTPAVTTSLTTSSTSFDLINTTATTVNFAGGATTLGIGATSGTTTVRNALTVSGTTVLGPASIATQATARTLTLADQGKVIDMTNSSDAALTIPPNSSVAFPVGTQILVIRNGTGKVSFTPGAGVTLRSDSSKQFISTQYSAATLVQRATDEWYLIGNLAAS
jgi:hypothetical protein